MIINIERIIRNLIITHKLEVISTIKLDLNFYVDEKKIKIVSFYINDLFPESDNDIPEIRFSQIDYIFKSYYLGLNAGDIIMELENDIFNINKEEILPEDSERLLNPIISLVESIDKLLINDFNYPNYDIMPVGVRKKIGLFYLLITKKE